MSDQKRPRHASLDRVPLDERGTRSKVDNRWSVHYVEVMWVQIDSSDPSVLVLQNDHHTPPAISQNRCKSSRLNGVSVIYSDRFVCLDAGIRWRDCCPKPDRRRNTRKFNGGVLHHDRTPILSETGVAPSNIGYFVLKRGPSLPKVRTGGILFAHNDSGESLERRNRIWTFLGGVIHHGRFFRAGPFKIKGTQPRLCNQIA